MKYLFFKAFAQIITCHMFSLVDTNVTTHQRCLAVLYNLPRLRMHDQVMSPQHFATALLWSNHFPYQITLPFHTPAHLSSYHL